MRASITAAIPTIPTRDRRLTRAVASVIEQTHKVDALSIAVDLHHDGAAATRDRALNAVATEWVAFLDDDDVWMPRHLACLIECQRETNADLVYPWFIVEGGTDPFPQWFGVPWDNAQPHAVPVTFLARTEMIHLVGGFSVPWDETQGDDPGLEEGHRAGEEYRLVLRLVRAGAKIVHLPERSWRWFHHEGNTSGLPSRW